MTIVQGLPETGGQIVCDVCVLGTGPAGIAISLYLADRGLKVALVESGLAERTPETEELNTGEVGGIPYHIEQRRARMFGGSSNCWAGWCCQLSAEDLEQRPWMGAGGWPISYPDLAGFEDAAKDILDLGTADFDPARAAAAAGKQLAPIVDGEAPVETVAWLLSPPTRMGAKYGKAIADSPDISCFQGVTALEIVRDEQRPVVDHVVVSTPDGTAAQVRAKAFVCALGGLENARMLLLSNRHAVNGLGNEHDLVGRYFFEHVSTPHLGTYFANGAGASGVPLDGEEVEYPVEHGAPSTDAIYPRGVAFGFRLKRHVQYAEKLPQAWFVTRERLFDLEAIGQAAALLDVDAAALRQIRIDATVEVAPNFDSRVTLGESRDRFGQRHLRLDWRIAGEDRRNAQRVFRRVGAWLGTKGGVFRFGDNVMDPSWYPVGGAHHIGTTRMAVDPRSGVVNPDLRVHGLANLFMAGSSVFPSNGFGNPTYTIVLLALRLAEHLSSEIGRL